MTKTCKKIEYKHEYEIIAEKNCKILNRIRNEDIKNELMFSI